TQKELVQMKSQQVLPKEPQQRQIVKPKTLTAKYPPVQLKKVVVPKIKVPIKEDVLIQKSAQEDEQQKENTYSNLKNMTAKSETYSTKKDPAGKWQPVNVNITLTNPTINNIAKSIVTTDSRAKFGNIHLQ